MSNPNIARDSSTTFKPGQSGNPAGKPPGTKNFTTKVREALEAIADGEKDVTNEKKLIRAILKRGIIDGSDAAQKLIWEQLDGKPLQKTEVSGPDGQPLGVIILPSRRIDDLNQNDEDVQENAHSVESATETVAGDNPGC